MIVDARTLAAGAIREADLCIVGAGAAGITAALALADAGLSVIVLESGGLEFDPAVQNLTVGTRTGDGSWRPEHTRRRILGGTTSVWAGWCKPLSQSDFLARDYFPGSGWPFARQELDPYYELAHTRLELGPNVWDAAAVAAAEGLPLLAPHSPLVTSQFFQYSPPTRFGTKYRQALEEAASVTVYLHANVVDIVLDDARRAVSRLACRTLDGTSFEIEAGRYALAAGGLENVRLLLASRSQLEEGVANSSGLVGKFFMEHPHYYESSLLLSSVDLDLRFYEQHLVNTSVNGQAFRDVAIRGVLSLSAETRASHGLPAFAAQFGVSDPATADTGPLGTDAVGGLLPPGRDAHRAYRLTCRVEQTPTEDSRITLTDEVDALGLPRLQVNWAIPLQDRRTLRDGLSLLGAALGAVGLGRLWTPHVDGAFTWNPQPGSHHMGTTRMSADASSGVVNADGRCHDVSNLYILGSSVFPTCGDSNPTLTIVALAERFAAHVRETPS